jgi:MFS superfamily sulfate permease-like transporter
MKRHPRAGYLASAGVLENHQPQDLDQHLHAALSHGLRECRFIDMVRFSGRLFFANACYLEVKIIDHMEVKSELRYIIIEASGISMLDASGEEALSLIIDRVRNAGIEISFITASIRFACASRCSGGTPKIPTIKPGSRERAILQNCVGKSMNGNPKSRETLPYHWLTK